MVKLFRFDSIHASTRFIKAIRTTRPIVPEKKHTFVDVPFRSGSILITDSSASDVILTVRCHLVLPDHISIYDWGRSAMAWLSAESWRPLVFDDDPNFQWNAVVIGGIELDDVSTKKFEFDIVFRCQPGMTAVT